MKKKFIICTSFPSLEKEKLFAEEINKLGLNWWRWIPGTWLIIDKKGNTSAGFLRDKIVSLLGLNCGNVLVIEVTPNDWAGYGPENKEKNMFSWIRNYWENDIDIDEQRAYLKSLMENSRK
ncbi:MAG: hypothetical protein FWF63_09775 [Fibromonadales bacterium]|jgi:hypothetical protein|nr:hypothetical protein [Fibromonadales bacterium]